MQIRKICVIFLILFILASITTSVFAEGTDFITNTEDKIVPSGNAQITTAKDKVWGSVKLILQILALAAILWAGVRYMFASADQKADIKKSLTMIVIGAAIVFGTTLIIDFIQTAAGEVLGT